MRNYTSKKQKIEMYSKKYNKTEEEVYRILTEHEDLLTLDELKIRYDDEHIGELPQWLVEEGGYEALMNYIRKGIFIKYDGAYRFNTVEEFESYMLEFILKRIKQFNNGSKIVSAVANRMVWLWRQNTARSSYTPISLQDKVFSGESEQEATFENILSDNSVDSDPTQSSDLINSIMSIKDKSVRDVLIVIGYLSAQIEELELAYIRVLNSLDEDCKQELLVLQKRLESKYSLEPIYKNGRQVNKNNIKVTAKEVIKAMKFNKQEISYDIKTNKTIHNPNGVKHIKVLDKCSVPQSLIELQDYLVNIGLLTMKLNSIQDNGRKESLMC